MRRSACLICAGLALASLWILAAPGCRDGARAPAPTEESMTRRPLAEVIAAHGAALLEVPGVVGVYEGRLESGEPCLTIMVVRADDALRRRLPEALEGYPVVIRETGEIREMNTEGRRGAEAGS
jgi:hypothetical protein